jgi:hypothetical protein
MAKAGSRKSDPSNSHTTPAKANVGSVSDTDTKNCAKDQATPSAQNRSKAKYD